MSGKVKVADVHDAFGVADTMSVGDLFARKKTKKSSCKASDPPKEPAVKKARPISAEDAGCARSAPTPMASPDVSGSHLYGKSRFYAEYICLSDKLVGRQLFGHWELRLGSRPEDYGEMRVYSGSCSSGEMNSAKEESYQIAHSLGGGIEFTGHRQCGLSRNRPAAGPERGHLC
jgi:hypothetical protein